MYYTLDILLETCEEYKSKYDKRLKDFIAEFEAEPEDFVKRELDFFEHTLLDLKSGGDFLTGITNYEDAMNVIEILGWEKFKYATLCKIRFLSGEGNHPKPEQGTKIEQLKAELAKYGFFEIPMVKPLSEQKKQNLIELISTNDLPYRIAMFDYLGFLKYLKTEHFTADSKLFKEVANWFEVTDRAVKGNVYVLNERSKENRTRYTADQKKLIVKKDYENIK